MGLLLREPLSLDWRYQSEPAEGQKLLGPGTLIWLNTLFRKRKYILQATLCNFSHPTNYILNLEVLPDITLSSSSYPPESSHLDFYLSIVSQLPLPSCIPLSILYTELPQRLLPGTSHCFPSLKPGSVLVPRLCYLMFQPRASFPTDLSERRVLHRHVLSSLISSRLPCPPLLSTRRAWSSFMPQGPGMCYWDEHLRAVPSNLCSSSMEQLKCNSLQGSLS